MMPGVASGAGEAAIALIGAAVTAITDGSGSGVAACGLGATLGLGSGAAVGGTRMETAMVLAGALVGTSAGMGAGETAITACVGTGLGADELSGAGVGFGGAVGAKCESS